MVVIRWAALNGCTKPDGPRDAGQRGSAPMQERQARTGRRSVEREWGGRRREEDIMQRTRLRLSQLEAGRLEGFSKGTTRASGGANGDLSRIPREGRRTKIQQKGPWVFGGRRQRPLARTPEKKGSPVCYYSRSSSHSACPRAEPPRPTPIVPWLAWRHWQHWQHGKHWLPRACSLPGLPCHA